MHTPVPGNRPTSNFQTNFCPTSAPSPTPTSTLTRLLPCIRVQVRWPSFIPSNSLFVYYFQHQTEARGLVFSQHHHAANDTLARRAFGPKAPSFCGREVCPGRQRGREGQGRRGHQAPQVRRLQLNAGVRRDSTTTSIMPMSKATSGIMTHDTPS